MTEFRLGRKYILRIAKNTEQTAKIEVKEINSGSSGGKIGKTSSADLLSLPPDSDVSAVKFENHQIVAKISSTKKSSTNSTPVTITIYNVAPDTLQKIKAESTIILQAGYETDKELPIIYAGQVIKIKPSKAGPDRLLQLVCSEGYTVQKNVRFNKSFPPGNTYKQILDNLISEAVEYGIPLGGFYTTPQTTSKDLPPSTSTTRLEIKPSSGFLAEGNLMLSISKLCEQIGFRCYLALGKLYVEPKEYAKNLEVIKITPDLIIGEVQPEKDTSKSLTGGTTNKIGVKVRTFLDGRINLAKKIHIVEGDYKGYYDIDSVSHNLNYEGGDWSTTIDLVDVTDG